MNRIIRILYLVLVLPAVIISCKSDVQPNDVTSFTPPVAYEVAVKWADSILSLMTLEEKIDMIGGDHRFFTHPVPRLSIPPVMMADATMGDTTTTLHTGRFECHRSGAGHPKRHPVLQVPVVRTAVIGRIHAHRRYGDAVGDLHTSDFQRREQKRRHRLLRNKKRPSRPGDRTTNHIPRQPRACSTPGIAIHRHRRLIFQRLLIV